MFLNKEIKRIYGNRKYNDRFGFRMKKFDSSEENMWLMHKMFDEPLFGEYADSIIPELLNPIGNNHFSGEIFGIDCLPDDMVKMYDIFQEDEFFLFTTRKEFLNLLLFWRDNRNSWNTLHIEYCEKIFTIIKDGIVHKKEYPLELPGGIPGTIKLIRDKEITMFCKFKSKTMQPWMLVIEGLLSDWSYKLQHDDFIKTIRYRTCNILSYNKIAFEHIEDGRVRLINPTNPEQHLVTTTKELLRLLAFWQEWEEKEWNNILVEYDGLGFKITINDNSTLKTRVY